MKLKNSWTIKAALAVINANNYFSIEEKYHTLIDPTINLEKDLIKKDALFSLSEEAIAVVNNFISCKRPSHQSVLKFMIQTQKWKEPKINKVMCELKNYVECF
jgi:hypothetical protein